MPRTLTPRKFPEITPAHIHRIKLMSGKGYGVPDIANTIGIARNDVRRVLGLKPVNPSKPPETLQEAAQKLLAKGFHPDIVRANFGEHCP